MPAARWRAAERPPHRPHRAAAGRLFPNRRTATRADSLRPMRVPHSQRTRRPSTCSCFSLPLIAFALVSGQVNAATPLVTWPTEAAAFTLGADGTFNSIARREDGRNYLATNQSAPLLSLKVDGSFHAPDGAAWDASAHRLTLHYPQGRRERCASRRGQGESCDV